MYWLARLSVVVAPFVAGCVPPSTSRLMDEYTTRMVAVERAALARCSALSDTREVSACLDIESTTTDRLSLLMRADLAYSPLPFGVVEKQMRMVLDCAPPGVDSMLPVVACFDQAVR